MSYKIVVDSCGELTEEMKQSEHFVTASLEIEVDGYHIIDDATFDQKDFLRRVAAAPECPNVTWRCITVMLSMYMQLHYRLS